MKRLCRNQLEHLCLQFLTIHPKTSPKFGTKCYNITTVINCVDILYFSSSCTTTTEEYSEFLSTSQMSDASSELATMPAPRDVNLQQQQHGGSFSNSMAQMASFFEQQTDRTDYNRDDGPPYPSEHQTPTGDR